MCRIKESREYMKKFILGIIFGIIISNGIVYGVNTYEANTIEYSSTDASWEVNNVNDAINSLYSMMNELENIKSIGDATAAQILSGRTALVQGKTVTGTMISRGEITKTLNAGETFDVPAGYITGGTVTANSLASQTSATATAADIASGKTAWVNGSKVNGTASAIGTFTGSASLVSAKGSDAKNPTNPSFSLNVTNYKQITINVTATYGNWSLLTISSDSGISTSLGPGTYTYDISAATTFTFSSSCNISTQAHANFTYTLIP